LELGGRKRIFTQVAGSWSCVMPRYFFDVKNGHRLIDPAGLDCGDEEEAIRTAAVIARQIAEDAPTADGRHVVVLNSEREEVGKIPIAARQTA
jgi:hypothetical protein